MDNCCRARCHSDGDGSEDQNCLVETDERKFVKDYEVRV